MIFLKLNTKRTFFVGLAFLSICAFWQVYDSIIPLILKNTFQIGDTISGGIMALDNILALFMLPLFGTLSDRVNTPLGKRTPFIIGGTAGAVLSMLLIPIADDIGSLPLFVTALLFTLICMATYRSPAVALMPDVTPKPLRSKANAVINLMGAVGGMLTLLLVAVLVPKTEGIKPDYLPLFAATAVIMALSVIILVWKIKEKKLAEENAALMEEKEDASAQEEETEKESAFTVKKESLPKDVKKSLAFLLLSVAFWFMGYNAVTTTFSKYAQSYWKLEGGEFAYSLLIGTGAAILSYIPVGMIATKIGRKKTILFGVALLGILFTAATFFITFHPIINVMFALVGIAWAAINVNSYPMVVEMGKGSDVGKFTGFYYTFSMAAQIVTPILSGFLLEHVGYYTLFPYAAIFVILAFITMLFVKHGDSRPAPAKTKLEAFDTPD